jgi:hypothetical protein
MINRGLTENIMRWVVSCGVSSALAAERLKRRSSTRVFSSCDSGFSASCFNCLMMLSASEAVVDPFVVIF